MEREIRECAMKKQKSGLLFLPLITEIYVASKVKIIVSDERIKNGSILTARIVERITEESTATVLTKHPTA